MNDHTSVVVSTIPQCDICEDSPAWADARLPAYGSWANVCEYHFERNRCTLGLGQGQRLVLASKKKEGVGGGDE